MQYPELIGRFLESTRLSLCLELMKQVVNERFQVPHIQGLLLFNALQHRKGQVEHNDNRYQKCQHGRLKNRK